MALTRALITQKTVGDEAYPWAADEPNVGRRLKTSRDRDLREGVRRIA
jgi:hypothetical protein